jgi:hypothetical protein
VKIIDNFINKNLYLQIKEGLFSDNLAWFSKNGTVENEKKDIQWFSHSVYNNFKPNSDAFNLMQEFVEKLNISSIVEIRINLCLKTKENFKTSWHKDYGYKNLKTAIFYFDTDTTGTYFKVNNKEKLVKAKENRIVIFDSDTEHCAMLNNKIDKRIVINFNYYEKN